MFEWAALAVLAVVLLSVATYYLRQSIRTLQRTTPAFEMLPDERRFLRRQAWRRAVNSGLMILFLVLLVGSYAMGMQQRLIEIGNERQRAAVDGEKPALTPEQRQFTRIAGGFWIAMLLLLSLILAMAALDLFATRRYLLTQMLRIQTDRRAMMDRQIIRWREERNGLADD